MLNLILYLVTAIALLYASVLYGSTALTLLAFSGILLMGLAYVYLLLLLIFVRVSIAIPISVAEQGNTVDVELNVKTKSFLPITKLTFFLCYENISTGERGRIRLKETADLGRDTVIRNSIRVNHCGKYRFRLHKIRLYDLTSIFYLPKRYRTAAELYVMPGLYDTSVTVTEPSRHFMGESDIYDDVPGGMDASEILQIRPFQDGDKIQSIHWKMTAKTDELMVRENRQPLGCPVVLFLDLSGSGSMDAFFSLTAAVSFSMIDQKCAHYVTWYSGRESDVIRVRVDDEESFYLFLMMLYEEKREKKLPAIQENYKEKYKAEPYVTGIIIHSDLTLCVGETYRKTFNPTKLKQDLSEVEFVV